MTGPATPEHPPMGDHQMIPAEHELIGSPVDPAVLQRTLDTFPPMSPLGAAVHRRAYEVEHDIQTTVTHDSTLSRGSAEHEKIADPANSLGADLTVSTGKSALALAVERRSTETANGTKARAGHDSSTF